MQTAFKLGYSLVVAILFVLFVILGQRTFYDEPEAPPYPSGTYGPSIQCEPEGRCIDPNTGRTLTEEEAQERQQELEKAQREFDKKQQSYYEQELPDYHRNVFILVGVLGVAAIAAGLYLYRRVEAMPLGLMLGGLGVIIFGWVQAAEEFGEIGEAPLFAAAAVGLAVVLAAGYWFLGTRQPAGGNGG